MQRVSRQLLVVAMVALAAVMILRPVELPADFGNSAARLPFEGPEPGRAAASLQDATAMGEGPSRALTTVPVASSDPSAAPIPGGALRYARLEFSERPTAEVVRLLRRQGVRVVGFAPPSSLMAGLPADFDARGIPGLLAAGEPPAAEKMGPVTAQLVAEAPEGDELLVFAEFFDGVDGEQARRAAAEEGLAVLPRGGLPENVLLVQGPAGSVRRLADRDAVALILNAPQRFAESPRDIIRRDRLTTSLGEERLPLYAVQSDGWDGSGLGSASLKYYVGRTTYDVGAAAAKAEVVRALNTWASVAAITWTETSLAHQLRSVDLVWLSPGDSGYPFDGPGGVLARAVGPCPPNAEAYAGDVEFDDADLWEIGNPGSGFDIYSAALHEVGHSLGLGHSEDTGAVMYAYAWSGTVHGGLAADDVAGITAIYATGPSPGVTRWESLASHGSAGELALVMKAGFVEARSSGLRKIRATFSRALDPASVETSPLVISGQRNGSISLAGCTASLDASGCVLTVTLGAALPDRDRYAITAAATLRGTNGVAAAVGQAVTVGALVGDVNGSGGVTSVDSLAVRARAGRGTTAATAGYDVDNSGAITGFDMQSVVRQAGRSLP